jgi:hypothetical protein
MARSVPGLGSGSTRPLLYTHKWHWQPDPQVLDSPLAICSTTSQFYRRLFSTGFCVEKKVEAMLMTAKVETLVQAHFEIVSEVAGACDQLSHSNGPDKIERTRFHLNVFAALRH